MWGGVENAPGRENLVLVPVNGSVVDARAVDVALLMARRYHAEVTAIHIVEVPQRLPLDTEMTAEIERGEQVLQSTERWASQYGWNLNVELLQARAAGPAIVDEAIGRQARLIVLGTMLYRRAGEWTVGRSTVPYVLRNAPCEVVVCRHPLPER
jgi:nucleotide-binding universal stress UspA family protein